MLSLFVLDADSGEKVLVSVNPATERDLAATQDWQTNWSTSFAENLPNKVALHHAKNRELLELMSYELDSRSLAVEVIYLESARHSNVNLLHAEGGNKRYIGIVKALFAYAVQISMDAGFDGVVFFGLKPAICWITISVNSAHGR